MIVLMNVVGTGRSKNSRALITCFCMLVVCLLCAFCKKSVSEAQALKAGGLNIEGLRHFTAGDYVRAAVSFHQAAEIDPYNAEYWNNAGMSQLRMGENAPAENNFAKAASLKDLPMYHLNRALALINLKEPDKAIGALDKALKADPRHFDALFYTGFLYNKKGDLKKAREAWERAAAVRKHHELENSLGLLDLAEEKNDDAIKHLHQAIALKPDHAVSHYNLGVALQKSKKPRDAILSYRKAVELDPKFSAAHMNMAITYADAGQKAEAISQLEAFLRTAPADMGDARADAERRLTELKR